MAVTESVKIVFEVENKELDATLDKLVKQKVITEEAAQGYRDLAKATSEADAAQRKNTQSIDQYIAKIAQAKDTVARLTKENAGLKNFVDFKSSNVAVQEINKKFLDNEKLIRAAKLEVKQYEAELKKIQTPDLNEEGFVSLTKQIKEAKLELQALKETTGGVGPEFDAAKQKVFQLEKQLADLNKEVALTDPKNKAAAFQSFGQSVVGAFQVATGALQAFGVENEKAQEIAQRLQGALNIVQGIESITKLKDTYEDLTKVLGFSSAAQNVLTGATTAGKVATDGAAISARGFGAALSATGIGAIVVAIGALAGAFLLLSNNENKAKEEADKLLEKQKELTAETEKTIRAEEDLAIAKDPSKKAEIERARAIREGRDALKDQRAEYNRLNNEIKNNEALNRDAEARIKSLSGSTREAAAIQIKSLQDAIDRRNEENESLIISRDLTTATIIQIKNRVAATKGLIDEENKATDAAEDYNDAIDDRISKERAAFEEARKVRQFSVELNKLYGASEEEILRQKLFNNEVDQEALNAILKKAEGTAEYEQIQSQLNDAVREEIFLRKQLENQLEIQKIALKGIETQQGKTNDKAKEAVPVAKEVSKEWQGSAAELIKSEDARTERQKEAGRVARELARETSDFIFDLQRQRFENEQTELDKQREAGLITEEQYQEKVLQLRKRQAQADKNSAIFTATLGLAEAIIKALNAPPPVSFQSVALATALATAQLARIIATPLPKFKQGTLSVPGRDTGDDSVMAMLRPGEAVIPTEMNREYAQTIKAIYTRKVSSKELNEFVESRSRMTVVKDEPVFNFNPVTLDAMFKRDLRVSQINSAVERSTGIAMPTINVKADVDTYALSKAMAKNKTMEVGNVESIGEAVAEALSKRTNRRQQI